VKRTREELLRELANDPAPPPRLARAPAAAAAWLAGCALFVAAATLATGPLRPGVLGQLGSDPGFALDLLLGALLSTAAILGLARLRIPGLGAGRRLVLPAALLLLAWFGLHVLGQLLPHAPSSTLGARPGCWREVLTLSLLPLAAALLVARRAAPLERGWTGLLAGLAAGALPALAMQLACMDDPLHALIAHLGPILAVAATGAALGHLVLRRV